MQFTIQHIGPLCAPICPLPIPFMPIVHGYLVSFHTVVDLITTRAENYSDSSLSLHLELPQAPGKHPQPFPISSAPYTTPDPVHPFHPHPFLCMLRPIQHAICLPE